MDPLIYSSIEEIFTGRETRNSFGLQRKKYNFQRATNEVEKLGQQTEQNWLERTIENLRNKTTLDEEIREQYEKAGKKWNSYLDTISRKGSFADLMQRIKETEPIEIDEVSDYFRKDTWRAIGANIGLQLAATKLGAFPRENVAVARAMGKPDVHYAAWNAGLMSIVVNGAKYGLPAILFGKAPTVPILGNFFDLGEGAGYTIAAYCIGEGIARSVYHITKKKPTYSLIGLVEYPAIIGLRMGIRKINKIKEKLTTNQTSL